MAKTRSFITDTLTGTGTSPGGTTVYKRDLIESGSLLSSGNNYHRLGKDDWIGGSFYVDRLYFEPVRIPTISATSGSPGGTRYTGHIWPNADFKKPSLLSWLLDNAAMDKLGTTAIARVTPSNPNAGLSVALGELRKDGLPSMLGSSLLRDKLRDYRALGSEYLNVEFGWKPFISDLMKFVDSVQRSEQIIDQYRRDSGRTVKRRYAFPDKTETVVTTKTGSPLLPTLSVSLFTGPGVLGTLTTTTTITQRVWFEGAFTYHIPMGSDPVSTVKRCAMEARKLYGLSLTPDVVWNLAPWTWAADWFGNFGDILTNVSNAINDGSTLRYGYVMSHTSHVSEFSHSSTQYKYYGKAIDTGDLVIRRNYSVKMRRPATPFGFGLSWDGLTTRQQGIIAALGISRGPRVH
nr:MAG: hypothetical protein 1 [Leviviridae sp.]